MGNNVHLMKMNRITQTLPLGDAPIILLDTSEMIHCFDRSHSTHSSHTVVSSWHLYDNETYPTLNLKLPFLPYTYMDILRLEVQQMNMVVSGLMAQ